MERLRSDVAALAAMHRRSASPGERGSAEWVAARLAEGGARDVRLQTFRYQHSYASAQGLCHLAGLLGAAAGGVSGAAAAFAALALHDLEFAGRAQPLRAMLPAGQGTSVLARVPAGGERRRTLVLVAHHDAAHTGYVWRSGLAQAGSERAERRGGGGSFAALPAAGLAASALGALAGSRALRFAGAVVQVAAIASLVDIARSPTVPGASDNATGVAAVLALAAHFAERPLAGTEVLVVIPGCEESGMGGMRAFMRSDARGLDPASTLVLGLDTLGAGEPVVLRGEGPVRTERYREADLALAEAGALLAGLDPPRRWRLGGWTDPVLARIGGLRSISLLSLRDGALANYHVPEDTPDRVEWAAVGRAVALAAGVAEAFSTS